MPSSSAAQTCQVAVSQQVTASEAVDQQQPMSPSMPVRSGAPVATRACSDSGSTALCQTSPVRVEAAHTSIRADLIAALSIFAVFLIVYGLSRPSVQSADDLQYLMGIRHMVDGGVEYHPASVSGRADEGAEAPKASAPGIHVNVRYLLDGPTSVFAIHLARSLGVASEAEGPVFAVRSIAGALGLAVFYLAVRAAACDRFSAVTTTAGLGSSLGYWLYSVHPDQTISCVTASMLAILAALRIARGETRWWSLPLLLGSLVLATLLNATAVFLAALLIPLTALSGRSFWAFVRTALLRGTVYGSIVAVCLIAAISTMVSPDALIDVGFWKTASFAGHPQYGLDPGVDTVRAVFGLAKSFSQFPADGDSFQGAWRSADMSRRVVLAIWFVSTLTVLAAPIAMLLRARRHLVGQGHVLTVGIGVFTIFSLFAWWWEPTYAKYWILPLVGWWLVVALLVGGPAGTRRPLWRGAVMLGLILVCGLTNYAWRTGPESQVGFRPWRTVADALTASRPDSLFISPGHPADFYLAYYARRETLSVNLVAYDRPSRPDVVLDLVRARVERQWATGSPVYVYGLGTPPGPGMEAAQLWLESQRRIPRWAIAGLTVDEIFPNQRATLTDPISGESAVSSPWHDPAAALGTEGAGRRSICPRGLRA